MKFDVVKIALHRESPNHAIFYANRNMSSKIMQIQGQDLIKSAGKNRGKFFIEFSTFIRKFGTLDTLLRDSIYEIVHSLNYTL